MQHQFFNSDRGLLGNLASRFSAILAMTGLLLLSACDGGGKTVTEVDQVEPGTDGVVPTLSSVTIKMSRANDPSPNGTAEMGQSVRVDIEASEGLMVPVVYIMGVRAEVTGSVTNWSAIREMTDADADGDVNFSVAYRDISGELGETVTTTTDGSAVLYCVAGCPDSGGGSLAGDWRLDGEGAAGIGPAPLDTQWFNSSAAFGAGVAERPCWFDDVYRFGSDGSFNNIQGDETWVEAWQGGTDACGAPVAPHDGSTAGTWTYDEDAGTLIITGTGNYLGLAKVVNGGELASPGAAPDSITYTVEILDGDSLTVYIETNAGEWWTYRMVRAPVSPLVGKWKLDGEGAAGIGPAPLDTQWFNSSAAFGAGVAERPCWFDDIYEFNADGSFQNTQGAETWVEAWQGGADACGAPVAPHDGSNGAIFQYDEDAGTLKLSGVGAYLGLAKVVNGGELASPGAAPESVTYTVEILDGDSLTVYIETNAGEWWTYRLTRVSSSPLVGKWKLAGEGAAGIGPAPLDTQWFNSSAAFGAGVAERPCWFDDIYHFGADGSFQNFQDGETWVEAWQGGSDACGAPVAPHNGADAGSFSYDEAAGTLTITGTGNYLGLAKVVNGGELASPGAAPDSVTYTVDILDGDSLTVYIETNAGEWWTYVLERVNDSAALAGKWKLDGEGAAGIGPAPLDTQWFNSSAAFGAGVAERPCWFDDIYEFNADGSFQNTQGAETWVEAWQGGADACGAPVAPHDGSNGAIFQYDEDAGTLKLSGVGAYLGLAKVVNGGELASPGAAPDSVTYTVEILDGDFLTVYIETNAGEWWTYRLTRVSNSPLAGNWKLDGEGAAGIGPAPLDTQWFNSSAAFGAGVAERPCWFDDIYHFSADGSFQNFQDGETWVEAWQGGSDACGAPVAPHDGADAGSFSYDEAASTLVLDGRGSYLGLAKVVNGGELASPGAAPDSVSYTVEILDGDSLTVYIETNAGEWWTYNLAKE